MVTPVSSEEYPVVLRLRMEDLLGDSVSYIVPKFQRDYCWDKEQLNAFWNDVSEAWENSTTHYLGNMLVVETGKHTRLIVDGQQRLTTVTLFILAAEKAISKFKGKCELTETTLNEFRHFVSKPGVGIQEGSSARLRLNRHNQDLLDDMVSLLPKTTAKSVTPFNVRIVKAMEMLDRKFLKFSRPEEIQKFARSVLNGVIVTMLVTDDENSSYKIYECLNNRGKPLTESDLIKNHIFSMSENGENRTTDTVESCWNQLMTMGSERVDEYIRTVLMLEKGYIARVELLNSIKRSVTCSESAKDLVQVLLVKSDLYSVLYDGWVHRRSEYYDTYMQLQQLISDLLIIGKNSQGTILMAAFLRYKAKKLSKFLRMVENFIFRNNIICKNDLNEQDEFLSDLGSRIWNKEVSYLEALEILKSKTPGDKEFKKNFSEAGFEYGPESKIMQYILWKLEPRSKTSRISSDATIEHVFPRGNTSDWRMVFKKARIASVVNRLGNLTLLDGETNVRIGNKNFSEKKPVLRKSKYKIARMIAKYDKWNYKNLCKHQKELADMALKIW